ncbi:hypothetical protein QJQ45_026948, partial [Haematococcus lacustris]
VLLCANFGPEVQMAAERKLKSEIDRTLKKVQEGQEIFEELWDQVHECDNSNQREKLEGELKKEIKKLQRLREQIKAWIAGADIKDKQPLMDARKSIEKDMERFKVCEREMKMAGRAGVPKAADPKEKAKDDARDWINASVESLTGKVEEYEYEMEELQVNVKKKQKPPARLTELEEVVARHKDHVGRLEKVLRCIDNETIAPEELEDLKSDMESYLNGEGEEDGIDFSNVDSMYEDLLDRLEAVEHAAATAVGVAATHSKNTKAVKEEVEKERERDKENERQRAAAVAAKAQLIAQGNNNIRLHDEEEPAARSAKPATTGSLPAVSAKAGVGSSMAPPPSPPPPASRLAGKDSNSAAEVATAAALLAAPPLSASNTAPSTPRAAPAAGLETAMAALGSSLPGPHSSGSWASQATAAAAGPRQAPAPSPAPAAPVTSTLTNWLSATTGNAAAVPDAGNAGSATAAAATGNGHTASHAMAPAAAGATAASAAPKVIPRLPPGIPLPSQGSAAPTPAGAGAAAGSAAGVSGVQRPAAPLAVPLVAPGDQISMGRADSGVDTGSSVAAASQAEVGSSQWREGGGPAGPNAAKGPLPDGQQQQAAAQRQVVQQSAQQAMPQPQQAQPQMQQAPQQASQQQPPLQTPLQPPQHHASQQQQQPPHMQPPQGVLLPPEPLNLAPVTPAYSTQAAKQILDTCFVRALPQVADTDLRRYRARHFAATPASYPRATHEVVDHPGLFRKMDPECLFFAFYFQPDSLQQYLAAHELKRQSWRFHKQHNAWFQRFTEPQITSEEYEQGAYVYFDYNIVHDDLQTGWCYRRKENFTFRYDALEDELRTQS